MSLNFKPRQKLSAAFPAMAWKGTLLAGFEREGMALDLWKNNGCSWIDAMTACYPELGLSELARLIGALDSSQPEFAREVRVGLFSEYDLRWSERLDETLQALAGTPFEFQELVDDKKLGVRDLSSLLLVKSDFYPFLTALTQIHFSKTQVVQALERGVELFAMGHPLNDLMPSGINADAYLLQLEKWRKPRSNKQDEEWRQTVNEWPWPSQVNGVWQRFGDQAGLEIKIRTTSPEDFEKKLERLISIRDTWSCNT